MLVIHSSRDHFIPVADAWAIAGSAGADLWVTDSDGHLGSYRADPIAYTERVVTFFGRHLAAPEAAQTGVSTTPLALAA
ncbi:MAG TPA: hypothetical protein VFF72_05650 [Caldimonas sp.]|nr:hypothetical protein [Caldimonas sp.]